MDQHIQRYTKYIYEDLSNLDIDTSTYKDNLHKSFEWFACIQLSLQHNSIFTRWEDISPDLREEKGMRRDMGIDSWDISGNRVAQMKCYQGNIAFSHLSTFLACCLKFSSSQKILYRTHESHLCSMIQSFITDNILIDVTVPGLDFREECKRIQSLTFQTKDTIEPFIIRPYQSESISLLDQGRIENKNVYLCIPTGCGKTAIVLHYHLNNRTEKLLVLVPLVNLMYQWAEECKLLKIKPYLVGTGKNHNMDNYKDESVLICVYDSFANIYAQRGVFSRYCIDEAHHIKTPEIYLDNIDIEYASSSDSAEDSAEVDSGDAMTSNSSTQELSYIKCIQSLSHTNKSIYISATLDKPIDKSLFYTFNIREAIDQGYLCDYQFVIPIFKQGSVGNETLANYLVNIQRESHCIIYAPSCKEGLEFTKLLNSLRHGCAGYIDCNTSAKDRKKIFSDFEQGIILFLVNIRILVEGYNAPHIRSIFFLKVSTSDVFVIQSIGRALRPHKDKTIATIYLPFIQQDTEDGINRSLERTQAFIQQLATYDSRIKKSIDRKSNCGYINVELGYSSNEDIVLDLPVIELIFNQIIDKMGNSNYLANKAFEKALRYKAFYLKYGKKPSNVLNKSKDSDKATNEQKEEQVLAQWFGDIKRAKTGKSNGKLYLDVEEILIEILGEKWYNDVRESAAIDIANQYKDFYLANVKKPSKVLNKYKSKDRTKATKEQKEEQFLANWFGGIKIAKTGKSNGKLGKLYLAVEEILIEILGETWYMNDDKESAAIDIANQYKAFYLANGKKPSNVLKKSKDRTKATKEQKEERALYNWFKNKKATKAGKGNSVLYPAVEKILIETLGEKWYMNDRVRKSKGNQFEIIDD